MILRHCALWTALLVAPADADVRFMQGMIHHHAQALQMVSLIASHTTRRDMQLLGERIATSQRDEINLMQQWLADHHQDAGPHTMSMPGMLTDEQMAQLAQANGPAFDRLFLEDMIQHHQGAVAMVDQLFHTPGAAQESSVFQFASDVNADQLAEIARMKALLKELTT
jgi:uncharacterized protein (DUF305 family)